jgi:two-component system, OmpR family, KDP operon response regulator KdpE
VEQKVILIVDDDQIFLRLVERVLAQEGYEVITATNGQEALRLLFARRPDAVLLDVVMPKMDGWQTCSRIREVSAVPIVLLTGSCCEEEDVVKGLECGADDYLTKPVGNRELVARMKALLRRAEIPPSKESRPLPAYSDDYLVIDTEERKVLAGGERVSLTATEFRLLCALVENAGRVLSHRQLLEKVWGWEYTDDLDYVRIYISHLRQKIEPYASLPRYIITTPGVGYSFQKATVRC